jgi:hypothetical protein
MVEAGEVQFTMEQWEDSATSVVWSMDNNAD